MRYIHIGQDTIIPDSSLIGIFDIEECSVSRMTAEYLNACQKNGRIVNVSEDMPKSFIVTEKKTYISNVSNDTINKRGKSRQI